MKLYIGLAAYVLLFIYLPLALIGLVILLFKVKTWKTRAWAIPLYLILAYAIPLGDVTWHSWNMAKVCPKAGLHVYRTVVVDGFMPVSEEYVKQKPYRFAETRVDKAGLVTRWERTTSGIQKLDHVVPKSEWILESGISIPDYELGVSKTHEFIQNRLSKEVIAERWFFSAWYSWVDILIGSTIDNSAGSCNGGSQLILASIEKILIPSEHQP